MKLAHYLLLSVSALFALLLAGVGFMYVSSTRDYLQEQLGAHAQETATSLALAIGTAANPADTVLIGTIVNPVFDRGQFEQIDIISVTGAPLASRKLQPAESQVPAWFPALFPIETTGGQALISAGWRQLGRVVVVPRPALAYTHLWQSTIKTLAGLALLYLVALAGLGAMLSLVLRALTAIESAAQDLGNRKFRSIDIRPRARELKSVVAAFNLLSQKIRSAINEEVTRAEQFRHDAFMDPLTGIYNRRGFELQLQQLLGPASGFKPGMLAMLEVDGLREFNSRFGFQKADELLRELAEKLVAAGSPPSWLCGRINGATFAVLQVGLAPAQAAECITALCRQLQALLHAAGSGGVASLHTGAVQFDGLNHSFSRLLAVTDLAMARAVAAGGGACEIVRMDDSEAEARGSSEWRRIIEHALGTRQLSLFAQTVLGLPAKRALQQEINVRLQESAGLAVEARLFVPMALRHKLGPRLDATILDLVLERLGARAAADTGEVAINICGPSLQDAAFLAHLSARLAAAPLLAKRLVFEISEAAFLEHLEATPAFAVRVRALGAQFALDNFLVNGESLKRLESLLPHYIKLSSKFTADLFDSAEARFLVSSLVRIARSLDIAVIAQGIEQEQSIDVLARLGVSGVQGYAIGKPELW